MNLIVLNRLKIGANLISRYVIILAIVSMVLIAVGMFLISQGIPSQTLTPAHEGTEVCRFLIIYDKELNGTSRKLLVSIASVISRYLNRGGVECQGYKFLSKEEISNYTIPVYPALIVESSTLPGDLSEAFLKLSSNHWLLKPPYLYYLIQSSGGGVSMEYIFSSKAYIVKSSINIPSLGVHIENVEELKDVLSWTSSTRVIEIKKVEYNQYPNLPYYPSIIIIPKESINISRYSPIVIGLGNNVFIYEPLWYNTNLLPYILNISMGNIMLEVHSKPSFKGPYVGNMNAPIKAIVFEDINCPYCARLFNNTLPVVYSKYVSKGHLVMIFNILTVHEESRKLHEALTCYYLLKKDNRGYYDLLLKLYRLVLEGKSISMNDFERLANVSSIELFRKCNATSILNEFNEQARRYGIAGTPAMLIWSDSKDVGVLIIGYVDVDVINNVINTLT